MKILLNKNGSITIDIEEYNQEEIAFMISRFLENKGVDEVKMYREKEKCK